jgi:outer membrane protein assembly factor BamB
VNIQEKQKTTWRIAVIAGIFSAIVSIIMILNYWQLQRSEPLENELLLNLVEQLKKDAGNEQLKEDIRRLDLMVRKAYFTKQWQIRAGAFMLIAGVVILVISLRMYQSYSDKVDEPGSEDRHLGRELIAAQKWIMYSVISIFALALIAAWLSSDKLADPYNLASLEDTTEEPEVEEIAIRTSDDADQIATRPESGEKSDETSLVGDPDQDGSEQLEDESEEVETLAESETSIADRTTESETPVAESKTGSLKFSDQYPSFRGPFGLGISGNKNIPADWDGASGRNVLWKTEVPLHGYNSPVIWGDKLFLTGADGTSQFIYCYNRNNGEVVWEHPVNDIARNTSEVPRVTDDTGYAAPTVATDGQNICAIYATGDVVCVDVEGKRKWARNLGMPDNHYGHSSSLLIYRGILLIQFDTNQQGKVLGLDVLTGETKWETPRNSKISWASPILANMGDHTELILSTSPQVAGYNPLTGEELWSIDCLMGEVGPSPGYSDGIVYATNEYAVLAAIKPGNQPEILWETNEYLPEVASPVVDGGLVFIGTSYGVIVCYDATNGELLWEFECDDGIYASPMIADNKVFFLDMGGKMHIFKKDRSMTLLGEPELGEGSVSTPSFSDGRIYLRGDKFLYCIGI